VEGYPFGPEVLVFKVAGKVFAIVGESSVSLKCDPGLAVALREEYAAVTAGYHLNKRHWNTVQLDSSVPDEALADWIADSYDLALAGASATQRARLARGTQRPQAQPEAPQQPPPLASIEAPPSGSDSTA
jgi:predicted DNA-binding protein (MmcQ/YjbR family)